MSSAHVIDTFSYLDCLQYNNIPNSNGQILDFVFTSAQDIRVIKCDCAFVPEDPHHCVIKCHISLLVPESRPHRSYSKRNFRGADYNSIRLDLNKKNWSNLKLLNINEAVATFYETLNNLVSKYVLLAKANNSNYPIWYSSKTVYIINHKRKFHKNWKKYYNPRDYCYFSNLRRKAKECIRDDYIVFMYKKLKVV